MVATQLITAKELWDLGDTIEPSELIEGELKTMVLPGGIHGNIQLTLGGRLEQFAWESGSGKAFGDLGYVLRKNPDTVLAPDLSFISAGRLPPDISGFLELAPDLAVEIVSPSNASGEIERKIAIYRQAGGEGSMDCLSSGTTHCDSPPAACATYC